MASKTIPYQIPAELQRTEAITRAQPDRHTPLRVVATAITRRGVMQAKVELVNAALLAFAEIIFDEDSDGVQANVDADGRLLVPAPWGRAGGRQWGLRNTEQRTFSWLMRRRSEIQNSPLFVYDVEVRQWLLGRGYSRRTGLAYCRTVPVTLSEWRAAWSVTRSTWSRNNLDLG